MTPNDHALSAVSAIYLAKVQIPQENQPDISKVIINNFELLAICNNTNQNCTSTIVVVIVHTVNSFILVEKKMKSLDSFIAKTLALLSYTQS